MKDDNSPQATPFSLLHGVGTASGSIPPVSHYFDQTTHTRREPLEQFSAEASRNAQLRILDIDLSKLSLFRHSPFERIPYEIVASIFELGYFDGEEIDESFREVVTQTCRQWRMAALDAPSLWSVLHISQSNVNRHLRTLPVYLQRSKEYPLNIRFSCFWCPSLTESIMDYLLPHSWHWKKLYITTPNTEILTYLQGVSVPMLTSLNVSHIASSRNPTLEMPTFFDGNVPRLSRLLFHNVSLRHLKLPLHGITYLEIRGYGTWPEYNELFNVLGGPESSLERLAVHVKFANVLQDVNRGDRPPILLPNLRVFEVFTSEWLTQHVSAFIQLFSCPLLQSLSVQESLFSTPNPRDYIIQYTTTQDHTHVQPPASAELPMMTVRSAGLYHALTVLPGSAPLTTLELHSIEWPDYHRLVQVCASLSFLVTLVLTRVRPTEILQCISPGQGRNQMSISIPMLRNLDISVSQDQSSMPADLSNLIGMFSLPMLDSLRLKNLTSEELNHVVDLFHGNTEKYTVLHSLTLANVSGITALEQNPTVAFPHLQHLSLVHMYSNAILRYFVDGIPSPPDGGMQIWPHLQSITIFDDANASKPLLHKVVVAREAIGQPISRLCLDKASITNLDSWAWLNDHVDLVELTSYSLMDDLIDEETSDLSFDWTPE